MAVVPAPSYADALRAALVERGEWPLSDAGEGCCRLVCEAVGGCPCHALPSGTTFGYADGWRFECIADREGKAARRMRSHALLHQKYDAEAAMWAGLARHVVREDTCWRCLGCHQRVNFRKPARLKRHLSCKLGGSWAVGKVVRRALCCPVEWPVEEFNAFIEEAQRLVTNADTAMMETKKAKDLLVRVPWGLREEFGLPISTSSYCVVYANALKAKKHIEAMVGVVVAAFSSSLSEKLPI